MPRPQFQPHFDAARAAGLRSVPHAGETTGPETVWDALRLLGAERIGHGTSAAQDPALLAHLAETGSRSRSARRPTSPPARWRSLDEHPIRAFRDAGVTITVNSDDPPMFGTDAQPGVRDRRRTCSTSTTAGVADLARAAVRASFAAGRREGRGSSAEIDAYARA